MAKIDGLRRDGRREFMQAREMYEHLRDRGFMACESRLKDEGGRCGINGVLITIVSKAAARADATARRKQFAHRVLARCDCGKDVPFGKLGQHRKSCNVNVWRD